MSRTARRTFVGPPLQLLGIALLLTAVLPAHAAAPPKSGDVACPSSPEAATRAAIQKPSSRSKSARVSEQVSRKGELAGRLLHVDRPASGNLDISLPAESAIAAAVGEAIVYTLSSPESGSEVHLLDAATGCDSVIARPSEIVRSALIDRAGSTVFVHSVSSRDRSDRGVVRIDLATGRQSQVVPALPESVDFGSTFMTELRLSLDGAALAVQSCGFEMCRTRVLNLIEESLSTFDRLGQGPIVGLTRHHLVTFAACGGLPCAVLSTDLQSGTLVQLADEALGASLGAAGDQEILTIETAAGFMEVVQ